jgi:FkbM family methyltransferase
MHEFLLRRLRRAPVIERLWDEYERMQAARDAAIAEREAFRSELAAALAMRDIALAEREAALAQRDPAQDRQGGYSTSEYLLWAYRLLLGREPEDPRLLQASPASRSEIVERFIRSEEFVATYHSVRHSAAPGRPVSVFLGDRVLAFTHRGNPIYIVANDLDVTPTILLHGIYEPHVERAIVAALRPRDTAIDLGANVGYHTLAMATAVGAGGRIHAFEANPEVMRLLKATMFVNKLSSWLGDGRVKLYEKAALDKSGTITLASAPSHYGSGHVITDGPTSDYGPLYSTRVEVPAMTLDDAMVDYTGPVELIHMDIEGSEPLALRGAQAIIDRSPHLKIVTEWSLPMMGTRADVGGCVTWLADRGFHFWRIEITGSLTPLDRSEVLTQPHCDLFLSRQDPDGRSLTV